MVTVQLHREGEWRDLQCTLVGVSPGKIDIAVLAPPQVISPTHPLNPSHANLYLSQDAFFLGYPFGLQADIGALNANYPLPLVKKACVSLMKLHGAAPHYFLLDGHNNPGFSGGPVVFSPPGVAQTTSVAGVVSGYRFEWGEVFGADKQSKTGDLFQFNTGIVIAYSISHAIELIGANPIGAAIVL